MKLARLDKEEIEKLEPLKESKSLLLRKLIKQWNQILESADQFFNKKTSGREIE